LKNKLQDLFSLESCHKQNAALVVGALFWLQWTTPPMLIARVTSCLVMTRSFLMHKKKYPTVSTNNLMHHSKMVLHRTKLAKDMMVENYCI